MNRMLGIIAATLATLLGSTPARAQTFDSVGTRAAGMSGAFVAVADDASAAYWNPAGFASGAYFSLVVDRVAAETSPDGSPTAGSRSGFLLAFGAPMLSLSYYRLRATGVQPATDEDLAGRNVPTGGEVVRVLSLVTHHAGVTLVQSIVPGVAVGTTFKLVRGIASTAIVLDTDRDQLLDDAPDALGHASNKFDADIGVMATVGQMKAGLTVRNVSEPRFDSAEPGESLRLHRQARAGVALGLMPGWTLAADFDLLKTPGAHGDVRDFAIGGEGRIFKRGFVRAGTRLNTVDVEGIGRTPSAGFGGSYAVKASFLIDAQVTVGSSHAPKGWGLAARFVY